MTSKILVADDSLTIQKVINITLGSLPYELIECHSEKELFSKIKFYPYDLILLDFNLSEDLSGYSLSQEIKKILPSASIMVMLGTFDTVDAEQLESAGIDAKIVKPFESGKFIEKCKELINNKNTVNVKYEKNQSVNDHVVAEPSIEKKEWEIRVPEVISKSDDDQMIPVDDDLEYPSINTPIFESRPPSSSKMLSVDDLNEIEQNSEEDITDPNFRIPEGVDLSLEEEINEDSDDLWAPDDNEFSIEFNSAAEQNSPRFSEEVQETNNVDYKNEIIDRLKEGVSSELKTYISEKVDKEIGSLITSYLDDHLDDIIFKIVPEIAEKVIREEFEQIKKKVLEDS